MTEVVKNIANDYLLLIAGKSATGKSVSLRNLENPEGVMYLNCETGKRLPFNSKFQEFTITDPYQVMEAFQKAEDMKDVHTIVVDSLTFLMDMFESVHVLTSPNTQQAWGQYAQFLKNLMSQYVARSTKNVIFTAHTLTTLNEQAMNMETGVKVKGSLMNNGVEAFFSYVLHTDKLPLDELKKYDSDLLNITPAEEALGFKYVFQTQVTKETTGSRIRSPLDMWDPSETYIDNDVQQVIDKLHNYYS